MSFLLLFSFSAWGYGFFFIIPFFAKIRSWPKISLLYCHKRLYWQLNTEQAFSMFSKVENTNGNEFEILPSHFNKTWRWHVGQMKNLELWRHLHICAQSLVVFLWVNEYITCPKNLFFWGTLYYLYETNYGRFGQTKKMIILKEL